jgi:hypothetical protein
MRIISFEWFHQNCKHFDCDYDFNKNMCGNNGNEGRELFTIDPQTKEKHYYRPCKEKYCPVLGACKQTT